MKLPDPAATLFVLRPPPPVETCLFYHSVNLSPGEEITGTWDLRPRVDAYLGHVDFSGRSVLEIGPASGFLSFHMEQRGAKVTALEPPMEHLWDVVPLAGFDRAGWRTDFSKTITGVRNSFWYMHHLHGSQVKLIETDPQAIPEAVGTFDIGVLAAVLLHCRAPFNLIESLARRVRKTMIITELYDASLGEEPLSKLIARSTIPQVDTWWAFTPNFIVNALGLLGFGEAEISVHHQLRTIDGLQVPMFTVVAHRS
ncbi:O-methyltransferase [Pseudomonas pohangensis]|uniref:O-methyltransferase n=1 Tax=Pseudomonas pohangensis TaxID=364197 RepID=A0A1H2EFD1_9PSED|nr:hypothetical protein [Pseudomonas pohangensis]SDT93744.1 O-methyltransferase [Pseudomonas pohangensis]